MTAFDLAHDGSSRLRPDERSCSRVVVRDERRDGFFKLADRAKRTASNALRGDLGEETLNSVQPRRARRYEVDSVAGMSGEPGSDRRVLVRGVVVQNQMHVKFRWHIFVNVLEKLNELRVSVTRQALFDDLPTQCVQCGEERGRSVANVVVRLASRHSRSQRQDRRSAFQGLNAALFVDAQHDRVGRWIHVESNDVTKFLGKMRIRAELEALHTVRLQVVRVQDPLNAAAANSVSFRQLARTPMRRVLRRRFHDSFCDLFCGLRTDKFRTARPRRIGKHALNSTFLKSASYLDDILPSDPDAPRDLRVGESIRGSEHDSGSKDRSLRRRRTPRQFDQRESHFWTHTKAVSSMIRHYTILQHSAPNCHPINGSGH